MREGGARKVAMRSDSRADETDSDSSSSSASSDGGCPTTCRGAVITGGVVLCVLALLALATYVLVAIHGGMVRLGPMKVMRWQTSQSGLDMRLKEDALLTFEADFPFSGPVVDVPNKVSERANHGLLGFGGAFTETSGIVFSRLSAGAQETLLQAYFGAEGIGFTLGRVHINSCDFSVDNYAFDDVDGDLTLEHFDDNVTRDTTALIPLIQRAQAALQSRGSALKLLATPWSPPAWMKTSRKMDHSGTPCLRDGMEETWASYLVRWTSAYKAHGVPIWAMTPQNEPEFKPLWEGCVYTASEEAAFLGSYLGPKMQEAHPEVLIFVYDHNKDHAYKWAKEIYTHPTAGQYADGVAFHWYSGDSFDHIDRIKQDFPQALLLATEATWERARWRPETTLATGDWSFGEGYAHDIIGDLNAGSNGWIDWNLLLDENGGPNHVDNVCDSAMMANLSTGELFFHPQYYFLGHFSKFIQPGSKLLDTATYPQPYSGDEPRMYGTCTGADGLQATSFLRPDGNIATIALNCGDESVDFKLRFYMQYATNATIPPHSIQTYVYLPPTVMEASEEVSIKG